MLVWCLCECVCVCGVCWKICVGVVFVFVFEACWKEYQQVRRRGLACTYTTTHAHMHI